MQVTFTYQIKEYLKTYDKVDDYLSNQNISSLQEAEQMNKTLQKISKNEMNLIFNEKKEKETKEKYSVLAKKKNPKKLCSFKIAREILKYKIETYPKKIQSTFKRRNQFK